jgi:hypothetical protein
MTGILNNPYTKWVGGIVGGGAVVYGGYRAGRWLLGYDTETKTKSSHKKKKKKAAAPTSEKKSKAA